MDVKTRVTVDIYGSQYTLAGHSSPEHMKRVAELVNDHMTKIGSGAPRLDLTRQAVLAAVNMGDELMKERAANEQLKQGAAERDRLAAQLEQALLDLEAARSAADARSAAQLASMRELWEAKERALQSEKSRLEAELAQAVNASQSEKTRLEAELAQAARQAEDNRRTIEEQQEMLGSLERTGASVQQLEDRLAAANDRVAELVEAQIAAKQRIARLEEAHADALAKIEAARERIAELESGQAAADRLVTDLESSLAVASRRTEELEAARAEAAAAAEAARAALVPDALSARLRGELDELIKQHSALGEDYRKLQTEYNEWVDLLELQ